MKVGTLFVAASLIVMVRPALAAQEVKQAEIEPSEEQIVDGLIAKVDEALKSARFTPVGSYVIAQRRAWLFRTLDRLGEYMAENPGLPEVVEWRNQLRLGQIRQELWEQPPKTRWLKQLRDEDFFVAVEESARSLGDYSTEPRALGYHIVRSLGRAFDRYAEALDDDQNREDAQDRLVDGLKELRFFLTKYRDTEVESQRSKHIKAIHHVIDDLDTSLQMPGLTEHVRARYLRPRIRVFLSSRLLTHVVSCVPLRSQPVIQHQKGMTIRGWATPTGSPRVVGIHSDKIGALDAGYDDPVVVNAKVFRKRIQLGVSACLDAEINKRFFVIQGAPDTAAACSDIALVSTNSSGCRLVDRVVDRLARRNFNGVQISRRVEDEIDDRVTKAANLINLDVAKTAVRRLREAGPNVTRVRKYRSRKHGLELTLLSSWHGFQAPNTPDPPDFLAPDARNADFSVSIRHGVSGDLAGSLFRMPTAQPL